MILFYISICFFSSRRRHTRFKCDWSSDVCSSDLASLLRLEWKLGHAQRADSIQNRSEERRVGKSVDLGGRRIIKKKKKKKKTRIDRIGKKIKSESLRITRE